MGSERREGVEGVEGGEGVCCARGRGVGCEAGTEGAGGTRTEKGRQDAGVCEGRGRTENGKQAAGKGQKQPLAGLSVCWLAAGRK